MTQTPPSRGSSSFDMVHSGPPSIVGSPRVRHNKYGTPPQEPPPPMVSSPLTSSLGNSKALRATEQPLIYSPPVFNSNSEFNEVPVLSSGSLPSAMRNHVAAGLLSDQFEEDRTLHHTEEEDEDEDDELEMEEDDEMTVAHNMLGSGTKSRLGEVRLKGFGSEADSENISVQQIYLEEEGLKIWLSGYHFNSLMLFLYYGSCILTGGLLFLLGRWIPSIYIRFAGRKCPLNEANYMVVENEWGELTIERVHHDYFGGQISSVFSREDYVGTNNENGESKWRPTDILWNLQYFDYRYIRFVFHPGFQQFVQNGFWKDRQWTAVRFVRNGLNRETHRERKMVFGENLIDIHEKSTFRILFDEVLHPFFVFQIFSILLWTINDYYYYAVTILIISTVSVVFSLIDTKRNIKKMREMSRFSCNVLVCRNGLWREIKSEDLVPGDIFDVAEADLQIFPCDALLLTGDCIVNESMLTGESVPVAKIPSTDAALRQLDPGQSNIPPEVAKHFLFSGTKIVRVRGDKVMGTIADDRTPTGRALAMVVRTGFNTAKGSLVRAILFPRPNVFKFYQDSFKFIGVLAFLAICGFFVSLYNFIKLNFDKWEMMLRALDLITIVVPPALPATMTIGTNFALRRLREKEIFCISPNRVNVAGKVDVMCFDKTGTLTEEGLDVLGIRCVNREKGRFTDLYHAAEVIPSSRIINPNSSVDESGNGEGRGPPPMLCAMATCHALKLVNGELIGDPLDLKMFEFTRWTLEEGGFSADSAGDKNALSEINIPGAKPSKKGRGIVPTVVRPPGVGSFRLEVLSDNKDMSFLELGIIRTFDFVSSLRRMSVIIKRLKSKTMEAYVKGAPEIMSEICAKDTIPEDYMEKLSYYTHHGYRVIACAYKRLDGLTWVKAQKIKREQVESDLHFLGFIVFENKLKPGTSPVISILREARIRQTMCTGDNVLTAISVSRECGIVNKQGRVYVGKFLSGGPQEEDSALVWENVDDPNDRLKADSLMPEARRYSVLEASESPYAKFDINEFDIALSGDVYEWMVSFAPVDLLNRMLVKGQVYARMSPDQKHDLVERLQSIGYSVGFCGDGANDCGALRAADVGLSLSEAEASVAAPFTSRSTDISCVLKLIREGRAALVTSFSCFKYMALYSLIQFTTVSFLYSFASNLGDFQFLYIDLFLILPIAVFMGRTGAYPKIFPKQPTASLVSKKVLTSLIGQVLIQGLFQMLLFFAVRAQPWYTPPVYDPEGQNILCFENTTLFLFSCFQYILIAVVFSVGPPYRKPMWTNGPFVITTGLLLLLTTALILAPANTIPLMELVPEPLIWRMFIGVAGVGYFALAYGCEKYWFPPLSRFIGSTWRWLFNRGWAGGRRLSSVSTRGGYQQISAAGVAKEIKPHRKIYKRVMEEMSAES
ncbi:uncharacterized protein VTP21DRAFT_2095 [Calcarisporiella thermophila]|uniref:uncharacterized protein n=1 Tax=Calcarisporiella thermophila TaxID=911321 RepID=UPI003743EB2E